MKVGSMRYLVLILLGRIARMDWILRLEKESIEDKVRLSCERLLRNIILNYTLKIYRAWNWINQSV